MAVLEYLTVEELLITSLVCKGKHIRLSLLQVERAGVYAAHSTTIDTAAAGDAPQPIHGC